MKLVYIIPLLLFIIIFSKSKKKKIDVDMNDVMKDINLSKSLYKELTRKCHPDRFVNTDKELIANKIFQDISNNKSNYSKLIELKQIAKEKLNIKL